MASHKLDQPASHTDSDYGTLSLQASNISLPVRGEDGCLLNRGAVGAAAGDTTVDNVPQVSSTFLASASASVTPTSTAMTPASTAMTPASTAMTSASTAMTSASTAMTPASTAMTPASTAMTSASTAMTPASTAMTSASTVMTPASTAMTPASTDMTPVSTAMTPASTAMTPASTAMTPASTAVTPASTAVTPASTAMTPDPTLAAMDDLNTEIKSSMAADETPATGSPIPSPRRSPVVSASNSLERSMKPAISGTAKSDDAKLELTESDFQLTNGCPDVKVEKKEQPVASSPSDDIVTPVPKPRQLRLSDHSNSSSEEGVLEDELQSFRRRRVEGTVTQEDMAKVIDQLVKICQEQKGEIKALQDQVKTLKNAESERKKREERLDKQMSTLSSRNENTDERLSGLTEAHEEEKEHSQRQRDELNRSMKEQGKQLINLQTDKVKEKREIVDLQEKAETFTEMHRETKERQDASECEISAMKASQSAFEFQVASEFSDVNIRISRSENNIEELSDRYEGLSAATSLNRCQIRLLRNDVREAVPGVPAALETQPDDGRAQATNQQSDEDAVPEPAEDDHTNQ